MKILARICNLFRAPEPQQIPRMVADVEMNRTNEFWRPYIGTAVTVLTTEPDGLVTVVVYDQPGIPIPGIDPKRFT